MSIKGIFCKGWKCFNKTLDFFIPIGDLVIRLWIARVFFLAGIMKIQTWDTTVELFTHEYYVPFLSPWWAAVSWTSIELVIPVLLVLGLFGRLPALILFVFNIVAVVSYPYLLTESGVIGFHDHFYWGFLLMILMFHGNGKLALDELFKRRFCK